MIIPVVVWSKMRTNILRVYILVFILSSYSAGLKTKEQQMSDRVQQLQEWSNKKALMRFDGAKFKTYVKSPPRNYSVVVMLTALQAQRQCSMCQAAHDEFQAVAESWQYSAQHSNKLFFVMIDYDDANDVFVSLKLNTAPVFMHFPPSGKPKRADTLDIHRSGFVAEVISRWIAERTEIQFKVYRPPNYTAIALWLGAFSLGALLLYLKRNSLQFVYNHYIWSVICLSIIFIMISGQMWNHIRGPPFYHMDQRSKEVTMVHPEFDTQFIAESYIVFALNAAIVIGMIILNEAFNIKIGLGKRKIIAVISVVVIVVFFSILMSVFRSKYHGYPYSFLLK